MKPYRLHIAIILASFCFVTLLSTTVIAGPGRGYGRGMGYNSQGTYGQPMGPGPCTGMPETGFYAQRGKAFYRSNLTAEQIKLLNEKRTVFFDATIDLRSQINSKRLALSSEMAKTEPDAAEASKLQQELSKLKGEFAQKRIAHMIEIKKIDPNIGRSFAAQRGPRGAGHFGGTTGRAW